MFPSEHEVLLSFDGEEAFLPPLELNHFSDTGNSVLQYAFSSSASELDSY